MSTTRFSDQIREAVDASELSRYAICKTIGLDQGTMSRFMAGKAGLSMEVLDKLADLLALTITTRPTRERRANKMRG